MGGRWTDDDDELPPYRLHIENPPCGYEAQLPSCGAEPSNQRRAAPSSPEHPPQMRSKPAKPAGTAPSTFNRKARRDWTAKKRALSQNDNPENEPEALACPRRRHQTAPRGSVWTVPW